VERDRQFDHAEACTEVPASLRDGIDGFGPQLAGELLELLSREVLEIARQVDTVEQGCLGRF
jgi:hypothetical protein